MRKLAVLVLLAWAALLRAQSPAQLFTVVNGVVTPVSSTLTTGQISYSPPQILAKCQNGNLVVDCNFSGSGGSGTVNSGTANQIGYYAGAGTAISGTSTPISTFLDTGGQIYNVKAYGAKGDGRVSDAYAGKLGCGTTAGSATVTCADLNFTSADVGKVFTHETAGTSGAVWKTTVQSVTNTTTAVMAATAPSSTTAGASTPTRSIVCTDDTAAITSAIAAAGSVSGTVFFPSGFYCDAGSRSLTSSISLVGVNPVTYQVAGTPPDFTLLSTNGSWIDFEGAAVGLTGNNLVQVGMRNIGFTDFTKCMSFGGNNVSGLNFSTLYNVVCAGKDGVPTAANFSTIAYEFYNSQHIYADHFFSSFVNEHLHLATQGAATVGYTSANSTFKDSYGYTLGHTAANGNVSQPSVLIENLDGPGGVMGGNVFSGQFQVNSYANDTTANAVVINAGTAQIEGQQFGYMDIEGPAACGIKILGLVSNSTFNMAGVNGTTSYCPSATEGLNQLYSLNNSATIGAGLPATDALYGYFSISASSAYKGSYLAGSDGNKFTGYYDQLFSTVGTINGAGGNAGVVQMGGSTALIVNNANNAGAIQVQIGGGAGSSGTKLTVDNYGDMTVAGNCSASLLTTNANSGTAFGCTATFNSTVKVTRPILQASQSVVSSSATIAPTSPTFHVSGTTTINTITAPSDCTTANTMCQITMIPDGLWSTGTSGNIALATTAVVSKALIMTYDPGQTKWYPSY